MLTRVRTYVYACVRASCTCVERKRLHSHLVTPLGRRRRRLGPQGSSGVHPGLKGPYSRHTFNDRCGTVIRFDVRCLAHSDCECTKTHLVTDITETRLARSGGSPPARHHIGKIPISRISEIASLSNAGRNGAGESFNRI